MSIPVYSWRWTIYVIVFTQVGLPCPADEVAIEQAALVAEEPSLDDWFDNMLKQLDEIEDYTCTVVTREQIDGDLRQHQYWHLKYRSRPKSFYFYCLAPVGDRGTQVLFFEGQNDGRMFVRSGLGGVGPIRLRLDSPLVTHWLRTPFHKLNMRDLLDTAISFLRDRNATESANIRGFNDAKINGRHCTVAKIEHDDTEGGFQLRVFQDDELSLPMRFALLRSDPSDGAYKMIEAYTFVDLKINSNLTDADFDYRNSDYGFARSSERSQAEPVLQLAETDGGDKIPSQRMTTAPGRCWRIRLQGR